MIKTKFGSRVVIIDLFPSFGDLERVSIEFIETGFQTFINVEDLIETNKGEIRREINKLKEEKNEGRS